MEGSLNVSNLVKKYGTKTALDDVTFTVKEGSCFGLLGPNGAGKSTTMKIITGIIEADAGEVDVFGQDVRKTADQIRRLIGYVPQEITLYDKISAYNNLVFFGEMYGVKGKLLKERITEVLAQVGLSERANDPIHTYSGGMKRRINIAAAMLHKPKLIILDEPTVGIDPQSRNHIFEIIKKLRSEGVTIIYSTHYMEEVEALCDDIAIIDHGKVIVQGNLDDLLRLYATKAIYLELEGQPEPPSIPGITKVSEHKKGWLLETDEVLPSMENTIQAVTETGIKVKALEMMKPSLESVFLALTGTTLRD
ncbi:ABC transporter ATP-binding protein [Neobacillus niacini]|uniref:ABC transporter ATP-binding protein n=1 Tax=Neobacillus niacini TaxID=86668 RepID=UPI002854B6F9|nr:ABC transporter ATP-binding protein [Neobacillus niacini]MDR7000678.1 ABC-2 type transport system ATP-binding protein [Neobacillus niacini]